MVRLRLKSNMIRARLLRMLEGAPRALPVPRGAPFRAFVATLKPAARALGPTNAAGRRVVSGIGATAADAALRTGMEAIERASLTHDGAAEAARVITPARIIAWSLLSARQIARRALWNLRHPGRHAIAEPPLGAVNLAVRDGLPAVMIDLGHPDIAAAPLLRATSVGAAAGSSLADAALRALLELVERDAVAIWWYNRLPRPAARFAPSPWMTKVARWAARESRRFAYLDLTHDLRVPVVACVSTARDGTRPIVTGAAGLTIASAAESALRENLLFGLNLAALASARDAGAKADPDAAALLAWHESESLATAPFLKPARAPRVTPLAPRFEALRRALIARGHDVRVFDRTRAELGVPVVRVIVPGLRPTMARFAPGRLFDVPVELGWLKAPHAESELNPEPFPF